MTDFVVFFKKALAVLGLVLAPVIIKLISCFYKAAEQGSMIPCALLQGVPGAGKTSLAEAFAYAVDAEKFFYQANPGTGFDNLIGQPNLGAILHQDADRCISDGIIVQAVKAAMAGQDVVLILDEIDKSSPETDSYLLDFLQSRRIHDSNMQELIVPTDVKFWVFLTSNEERDLSDALMRRVRRITVERPSRSTVAEILGIGEDSTLLDVFEACNKLAISQLRSYLEDGGDPIQLDMDILSQYVDIRDIDSNIIKGKVPTTLIATAKIKLDDIKDKLHVLRGYEFERAPEGGYDDRIKIKFDNVIEMARFYRRLCLEDHMYSFEGMLSMKGLTPQANCDKAAIYLIDGDTYITDRKVNGQWVIDPDAVYMHRLLRDVVLHMDQETDTGWYDREKAAQEACHLLERMGMADLL